MIYIVVYMLYRVFSTPTVRLARSLSITSIERATTTKVICGDETYNVENFLLCGQFPYLGL